MAEKNLLVNEAVKLEYQAPNKETGLVDVIAEIYLPTGQKDIPNFPDVVLAEVGATGVYSGGFTPNVVGEWLAIYHKADGSGQVFKCYSVGAYNASSVGEAVTTVDGKVVTVDGKVDTANGKLDTLTTQVGFLSTPPMCS